MMEGCLDQVSAPIAQNRREHSGQPGDKLEAGGQNRNFGRNPNRLAFPMTLCLPHFHNLKEIKMHFHCISIRMQIWG